MTLFKDIEITIDGKALEQKCMSYHCTFELKSLAAESNHTLKMKFSL